MTGNQDGCRGKAYRSMRVECQHLQEHAPATGKMCYEEIVVDVELKESSSISTLEAKTSAICPAPSGSKLLCRQYIIQHDAFVPACSTGMVSAASSRMVRSSQNNALASSMEAFQRSHCADCVRDRRQQFLDVSSSASGYPQKYDDGRHRRTLGLFLMACHHAHSENVDND